MDYIEFRFARAPAVIRADSEDAFNLMSFESGVQLETLISNGGK